MGDLDPIMLVELAGHALGPGQSFKNLAAATKEELQFCLRSCPAAGQDAMLLHPVLSLQSLCWFPQTAAISVFAMLPTLKDDLHCQQMLISQPSLPSRKASSAIAYHWLVLRHVGNAQALLW